MPLAMQTLDFDDGLSILTEMIVSEIGPREALACGEARVAAVARVERVLQALIAESPPHASQEAQCDDLKVTSCSGARMRSCQLYHAPLSVLTELGGQGSSSEVRCGAHRGHAAYLCRYMKLKRH
jgi:hypothetical protein